MTPYENSLAETILKLSLTTYVLVKEQEQFSKYILKTQTYLELCYVVLSILRSRIVTVFKTYPQVHFIYIFCVTSIAIFLLLLFYLVSLTGIFCRLHINIDCFLSANQYFDYFKTAAINKLLKWI